MKVKKKSFKTKPLVRRVILFYISANLLNVRLKKKQQILICLLPPSTYCDITSYTASGKPSYICKQLRAKKVNVLCYENRFDLADLWERAQGPPGGPWPHLEIHCSILCSHNTLDWLYHLHLPHSIRIICSFSLFKFLKAVSHEPSSTLHPCVS